MSDHWGRIADQIGTRGASSSSDSSGSGETADFDPRPPSRVDRSPDDDRDQADPRSRSSSSRSRTGTETVRGDVSIGSAPTVERAAQIQDVDFSPTGISGARTVERAAQIDQSGADFTSDSGLGTIADAQIPGTDSTVLGVVDRADQGFRSRVVDPAASGARRAGETDFFGPGGTVARGSEERGQLFEDFTRSAGAALNVPGFVGGALRAGPRLARLQGDPEEARELGEAGVELGGEAAGFARENPFRAGAMAGGALAGAGVTTGTARLAGRTTRTTDDISPPTEPTPQPGTGGVGSVLDPSDVRQPASRPTPTPTTADRISGEIDAFLGDVRGQAQIGRQRQRPDGPDGGIRPPQDGRDVLGGSPRDRMSGDITSRQRRDLDQASGTFDGAGDPIMARPPDRGMSVGSRMPRDPLDTRGGRSPTGGSVDAFDFGGASIATGSFLGQQMGFDDELDIDTGVTLDTTQATGPTVGGDMDIWLGTETGTTPDVTTDPFVGEGERTGAFETVRGRTAFDTTQQQRPRTGVSTRGGGGVGDPTVADPTGTGPRSGRPSGRPRGRRRARDFDFGLEGDADEFEAALFGADDDTFDTGILSGSEAVEQIGADFDESDFRL